MLARWLEFIEQGMRATEREAVVSSEGERERDEAKRMGSSCYLHEDARGLAVAAAVTGGGRGVAQRSA